MQTIWAAKAAKRTGIDTRWRRERWKTPDHDFIDADHLDTTKGSKKNSPLLVLLHGLEGSTLSHYAHAFAEKAVQKQWRMVVPHFRGCSGEINRQPRAYHSGDWPEVDWILAHLQSTHQGPIYVAGVSLGGNALMRWAGELGAKAQTRVQAAAAICSPLDLVASGMALGEGLNRWIYTPMFLRTMKPKAKAKWQQYPGLFDLDKALRAKTLFDFDDVFTAPIHGFDGVMDYWTRASAKPHLQNIAIPALLLNARNDPFVPAASLPQQQDVSAHVTLWQPKDGGHVGFAAGDFPCHLRTMPQNVSDWFEQQAV